jgi:cellulose synthase/poly-beta-1,6-N-acetylglucosamine synthase-like glycosyltransferase
MAIQLAIDQSIGDWIVTTDADCALPPFWLNYYDDFIHDTGKKFIAAPVCFFDSGTFLSKFQCLDFLSLQGVTAASVGAGFLSMCNGANLCYQRLAFYEVGGFAGIDNLASGDDMLLMQKIQKQDPGAVGYLFSPHSVARTWPMGSWKSFINQRVRWASKAGSYQDVKIKLVLLLVYLWNLGLLILLISGIFMPVLLDWWLGFLLLKFGIEWLFMRRVSRFFGQGTLLRSFFWMQPFHMLYTVIAGWLGLFGSYQWKGRQVK